MFANIDKEDIQMIPRKVCACVQSVCVVVGLLFSGIVQASELKTGDRFEFVALHLPDGSTDFVLKSKFSADTAQGMLWVARQNDTKGKNILQRQAENGDYAAQCVLGIMQIRGAGFSKNVQAGMEQIERAAQNGFTRGYYYLSYISAFTQFSVEQSLQWAIKGAERGDFTALTEMASRFFNIAQGADSSLRLSKEQALRLGMNFAREAAKRGCQTGYNQVSATCRDHLNVFGNEAVDILREMQPLFADATNHLTVILAELQRYEESLELALKCPEDPNAQYIAGTLYLQHISPQSNLQKGLECMKKAAEMGLCPAIWFWILFYENPSSQLPHISGLLPAPAEARRLVMNLATSGDHAAKAYLARYYYEGFGGEQNVRKAAELLQSVFSAESTYCPHAEQYYWQWKSEARKGEAHAQEFMREFGAIGGKEPTTGINDPSLNEEYPQL